ncbi:carboxypeptidase-like regulatory domain-containing protein [bacterium]|nr:carboxypeptidase-like regulatory domain-containing protein [bacterium]
MQRSALAVGAAAVVAYFSLATFAPSHKDRVGDTPSASPAAWPEYEPSRSQNPTQAGEVSITLLEDITEGSAKSRAAIAADKASGRATPQTLNPERVVAQFTVRSLTSRPFTGQIALLLEGAEAPVLTPAPEPGDTADIRVTPGEYTAWVQSESGIRGPAQLLTISDRSTPTELEAPLIFEVLVPLVDASTREPLPGATVQFHRSDSGAGGGESTTLQARSNDAGLARLEGVTPGDWTITADSSSHWAVALDLSFDPDQVSRLGTTELDSLKMYPRTEKVFRLTSSDAGLDPTSYSVSYDADWEGTAVQFSASGMATLSLGRYHLPLYVKLRHPSPSKGAQFRYLDEDDVENGEEYIWHLDGPQTLEVTLEFAEGVEELIGDQLMWLPANFRDSSGNIGFATYDVSGPGVYSFPMVRGSDATVAFNVGDSSTWAAMSVGLASEGLTSCTLRVEQPPQMLRIRDGSGAPVSSFWVNMYADGDPSGWSAFGTSDESGSIPLPRIQNRDARISGSGIHEGLDYYCIDIPLALGGPVKAEDSGTPLPGAELRLTPATETFFEARGQAESMRGLDFELQNRSNGDTHFLFRSSPEGKTPPFQLVDGSQAMVHVVSTGGHWTPTPVFELKPGRNEVEVHDSGQLNISSEALLDRVMSVRYGVPVSTWRAQDNLFQLTTKNGVLRYRTPVGDYDVTMPDGSVERITLTKFQEVSAGI